MKKILITGGLGNLGSWLTDYLAKRGYQVTVLTKHIRKIQTDACFTIIEADLTDFDQLRIALQNEKPDVILHAGSANDGFVPNYFQLAIRVNTLGTRNLLEWAKYIPGVHFVYFSTFQVYGKYSGLITEETPTMPVNDYGSSHLFAEILVQQLFRTSGMQHTIVRLTNSYGCPMDVDSSKWYLVLNDLSKSAFEQKKIVLKSNGLAPRDMIWMGTVCEIIQQLIELPATNTIYNISGEKTLRMLDVAAAVRQAYMQRYGIELFITRNEADQTIYPSDLLVSSGKLKKIVSYEAPDQLVSEAIRIFELLEKNV